jgi:asparagine synthase (glutamine-hydrolysing)
MCGIAGLIDFSNGQLPGHENHSGKVLRIMLDHLRHRGPDDRGEERFEVENGPPVYLGHQRLSIIDLTKLGHQPMPNDTRSIWVSTNSEIYNFKELRQELESKSYTFRSQSDTEVLLKAYEEWGVDCLKKLRGMFAFAIWDADKKVLFLARDRLGIKPLYYFSSADCFLFASEVRALAATGIPDTTLSATGLFQFLSFGSLSAPDTLWESIKELMPGHYLLVTPKSMVETQYWDPLSSPESPADSRIENSLKTTLKESVSLRQVSDVTLGAFLSGGIDSSAVVSLMNKKTDSPVETLSVVFKEPEYDESVYSKQVAEKMGTRHHTLELDESDLVNALPDAISAMDQPTVDGINTYLISRCARGSNWKVALSGIGGDELFGGYDSFSLIPKLSIFNRFLRPLPRSWRNFAGNCLKRFLPVSDRNNKLAQFVRGQKSGGHDYFLLRALFTEDRVRSLFRDKNCADNEILKHLKKTQQQCALLSALHPLKQISYLELTHYLPNTLLRDTDMMSMAHGLEIRVPLIDHRLVELMFSFPPEIQFARPPQKSLLVNSLPTPLPPETVHRKKMGFTLPFEHWMRNELLSEVESVLLESVAPLADLLDETEVRQVWEGFLARRISWSRPWALYILKKWIKTNHPHNQKN